MIINTIYEHQNLLSLTCFLPGRAKDLSAPLYNSLCLTYDSVLTLVTFYLDLMLQKDLKEKKLRNIHVRPRGVSTAVRPVPTAVFC